MKVLITGYFGFGNVGDEMILHVMKKRFKKEGYCIYSLVNNPQETNEFDRSRIKHIYHTIRRSDIVINGGGGILQDKTSSKSLYYYLSIIKIAKMLHKKVTVFAQGIGPVNKKIDKIVLRNTLNTVDLITVRDRHSSNILTDIGVKKEAYLTGDLAFLYEREKSISLPFKNFIIYAIGKAKRTPSLKTLTSIGDYIQKRTHLPIIILPFYPKKDSEIAEQVANTLKSPLIIPKYIEQYPYIVGKSKFVVGMRYHSLVVSGLKEKAFVGLSYDPKVIFLMKKLEVNGIEDYGNLSLNNFKNVFEKNFEEQVTIQKKLAEKVAILKEGAEKNFEFFKNTFKQ